MKKFSIAKIAEKHIYNNWKSMLEGIFNYKMGNEFKKTLRENAKRTGVLISNEISEEVDKLLDKKEKSWYNDVNNWIKII